MVFIVSHTHWDREWYQTYDRFRVNLVRVVGQVLDRLENDPAFSHFLLDGQSVILEDYLEVCPQDGGRIKRLVETGKLSVGPWYILPDEFLVSAEATVRNLRIGHQVGNAFGTVQKVGYMPDSFGHIAQLPQILRSAGIDSFIYTRGNGNEIERLGCEYVWQAPDGSEVLAINQCGGYCNAGGLGLDEEWEAHTQREVSVEKAVQRISGLFDEMSEASQGNIYLINNGCDHFPPQRDLGNILEGLRRAFPGTEFVHSDLASYVKAVRRAGIARQRYVGELAKGRLHHILAGVWSSRIYLKQQNDRAQRLLSCYAEPFSAYSYFMHNRPYQTGLIDYCWKQLLKNHPHDSICGCSTDEVHAQMESRFSAVRETGEQLVRDQLQYLTPTFARNRTDDSATVICVANPLPVERSEVVERLVVLQPFGTKVDRLQLVDQKGRAVPFEIVALRYVERFWGVDYRTELLGEEQMERFQVYLDNFGGRIVRTDKEKDSSDCFITLHFWAERLPGIGHRQFYLREAPEDALLQAPVLDRAAVSVSDNCIENEYYQVRVHEDGTFDVRDKIGGYTYTGLNRLEDTEDVGDEYDYSPSEISRTMSSNGIVGMIRCVRDSGFWGQLEVEYDLNLPSAIEDHRRSRSDTDVACRTSIRVGLRKGSRTVDVETLFHNLAQDHRLRAEFPTSIKADTVISDGHFYQNHRPVDQSDGSDWRQPPSGTYPQQDYTLIQDGERGLAILDRGLPEVQATRTAHGDVVLSLTLLRAIGWLSRDDLPTRRRENAGPTLFTPDAQCPGVHRFEYAVVPFVGNHLGADVKGVSESYRVPVMAVQGVEDGHVLGGVGLLTKTNPAISISAAKRHDSRDTLEIRLYNLTDRSTEERLQFGRALTGAWRTDLLGDRLDRLELEDDRRLPLVLRPHEILTVEVEFGRAELAGNVKSRKLEP